MTKGAFVGKQTVLYNIHKKLGAKMVEFGGWDMPVQYSGIIDEHNTVRNQVGLFDVSHMGQIFVSGNDSMSFLQRIVPQDISKLNIGSAIYCQLPYNNGGLVDDLIIYRIQEKEYLIIANASNIEKDYNWLNQNSQAYVINIENKSNQYSMLALQGPNAYKILIDMGIDENNQPSFFTIKETPISKIPVYIARTGYTGEDGFEIITRNQDATTLWEQISQVGNKYGLKPIGLGARDTLRLEAALMLYGNELNENTTPVEAGLKWSIPTDKKEDYNGKSTIINQIENGVSKKLIGFEMIDKAIARHEYDIYYNNQKVGNVTSGGFAPSLNKNIGLGYVDTKFDIKLDSIVQIMVRNKLYNAKVVKRPFIKKKYNKNS